MPEMLIHSGTQELTSAILLYTGHQHVAYASIHDVKVTKGVPRILAGRPITIEAILQATTALAKAAGTDTIQWADDRSVATGPTLTCWWTPACERWMHFNAPSLKASQTAMQPPLVWVSSGGQLYVFALEKNERPNQDTALLQSPYFNVYTDGQVCQGSMVLPSSPRSNDWVDAFFASTFTHPNPPGRKLTTFRGGETVLWKKQMGDNKSVFPVKSLRSLKTTLGQMIRRLTKE